MAGLVEVEKEELEWLLTSGVLGRSQSLARVLKFICEEHFEGRADQIKEYTIAVDALGRRPDFDPQTDTIVRVTAHSLRKRLLSVYEQEGASRRVRIVIPPGQYAPCFVHSKTSASNPADTIEISSLPVSASNDTNTVPVETRPELPPPYSAARNSWSRPWTLLLIAVLAVGAVLTIRHRFTRPSENFNRQILQTIPPEDTVRSLLGSGRKAYSDHSGHLWAPDKYCQGGTSVTVPAQRIADTEDPELYLGGARGMAHCIFPVKPGLYELHLYFAETSNLEPATRVAAFSINAGPSKEVDVVDEAGGNSIATSRVLTGVSPENDGAIHLDFISEVSPLNAVEILPAPSDKLLPVRIVASSHSFTDSSKQLWLSDRYFTGGRRGQFADTAKSSVLGLFGFNRIGRFRYTIPVVPKERYQVKLYFREPWFGRDNGGSGGPGSRSFNVSCNGVMLLENFDILREGGGSPVVKAFENVQASATGRLELSFTAVVNYPVVNAIEIIPEP